MFTGRAAKNLKNLNDWNRGDRFQQQHNGYPKAEPPHILIEPPDINLRIRDPYLPDQR